MNQIGQFALIHWIVALIFLLMGFIGLFPGPVPMRIEPTWHAILEILLGLIIMGVAIKFTLNYFQRAGVSS